MAVRGMPPPSPSTTIYSAASGMSAYREPYRAQVPQQPPPLPSMPPMSSSSAATDNFSKFRGFYEQLRVFLASEDMREVPGARSDPRSKLVKLNEAQFMELSTDVHDECIRRNSSNPTPFLPLRSELHPKRNQARQKLATLSKTKFRDLASDIFFELGRRFPQFRAAERPETPTSSYEDSPSQSIPYNSSTAASSSLSIAKSLATQSDRLASDSASGSTRGTTPTSFGQAGTNKLDSPFTTQARSTGADVRRATSERERDEQDSSSALIRRRPSEQLAEAPPRRSGESSRNEGPSNVWRRPSGQRQELAGPPERRKPSLDQLTLRPMQGQPQPQPQQDIAFSPPPTSTATLGVVNPMKSTIAEEEIEVPYGKDESDERPGSLASISSGLSVPAYNRDRDREQDEEKSPPMTEPSTAALTAGGLNALAGGFDARMREFEEEDSENNGESAAERGLVGAPRRGADTETVDGRTDYREEDDGDVSTASRGVSEFYDKMSFGRASVASGISAVGAGKRPDRESVEIEKLRREYEFKVATMNNRIHSLESDLSETSQSRNSSIEQLQTVKEELVKIKELTNDQASTIAQLKRDLDEARAAKEREAFQAAATLRDTELELTQVRDDFDMFKVEQANKPAQSDPSVDPLRAEVQALLNELNELSDRNEEMMHEKDNDAAIIRDLNAQIKEWKRKYESAKTELRHMKATSTLSAPQTPRLNAADGDHLPTSENGAIADVHVTAFQSSIDSLLAAGRSSQPTSVLSAMKNVVTAVAAITDDVRAFEVRPRKDKMGVDDEAVRALKDRASATLNNLVMASKNHGTSYGLSPVSLLDAAASHVSSTIVEIVRLLKIRRGTRNFLERAQSNKGMLPMHRSIAEQNSPERERLGRASSSASAGRDAGSGADRNSGPSPIRTSRRRSNMSGDSHNGLPTPDRSTPTNSSLPHLPLDATHIRAPIPNALREDEAVPMEGHDDAWAELKPYLEAQSESIVYHIQAVLGGIRQGAQATDLNESLTQIITIVSSIVAVCKDSLPSASTKQGQELLRELSEHCNTLSEAQVMGGEINKQMRQAMATASFGVAKALKELMKF